MIQKLFIVLIIFFSSLVIISCDKNPGEDVMYSPDLKMPVVTGLFFTGYDSPEVLGVWRNPSGSNFCYPSLDDMTNISFSVPSALNVKVWVVPARLPEQKVIEVSQNLNAYYTVASGQAVAILMNETKQAGSYLIEFHFKDSNGNKLPEGFYRIYVESGGWLRWCDFLNFRDESNYYKALVNQIEKQTIYFRRY